MRRLGCKLSNVLLILATTAVVLLLTYKLQLSNILHKGFLMGGGRHVSVMPVLIIGGAHHSGADLLRSMLDAHSEVRCDDEIFINSLLFKTMEQWTKIDKKHLDHAGVSKNVLDAAVTAFSLDILALAGEPFRRLCTNSQFMLTSADHVSKILPQAKFILMVRDGRAVVNSIITNEITYYGYNISNTRESLRSWNRDVSTMYNQCKLVGNKRCMLVHYEELVLNTESLMKQILSFVEVRWDERILYYGEKYKNFFTADYVEDPLVAETFTQWVDQLSLDVVKDMNILAPMLNTLGYNPNSNPPDYSTPDTLRFHSKTNL